MLTLAYPLRELFAQRAKIAALREQTAAQERRVVELQRQNERWRDPAYVRAQARERLNFVMPGETRYVVLEPDEAPAPPAVAAAKAGAYDGQPWYAAVWESLRAADAAPVTEQR